MIIVNIIGYIMLFALWLIAMATFVKLLGWVFS